LKALLQLGVESLEDLAMVETEVPYRGTLLIRKRTPLGPYRRPTPRILGGS